MYLPTYDRSVSPMVKAVVCNTTTNGSTPWSVSQGELMIKFIKKVADIIWAIWLTFALVSVPTILYHMTVVGTPFGCAEYVFAGAWCFLALYTTMMFYKNESRNNS
jgi:hypothetical protein